MKQGEYSSKTYFKEEDFFEHHSGAALSAKDAVKDDWHPIGTSCNDDIRKQRDYFWKLGTLPGLIFQNAIEYNRYDQRLKTNIYSATEVCLSDSHRFVTIRVDYDHDNHSYKSEITHDYKKEIKN